MIIEYSSNNSGGYWRLSDEDWQNLEKAGWKVNWRGRWLGALATSATRKGLTKDEAIAEFEQVTGQDAYDCGCSCCGIPHNFYQEDEED
jgi:hypothetical protein